MICYRFGKAADPFSQGPTFMATPFQNEPNGKRNLMKWSPSLIRKEAKRAPKSVQNVQRGFLESSEETFREYDLHTQKKHALFYTFVGFCRFWEPSWPPLEFETVLLK